MSERDPMKLPLLHTGVPGLDEVLGGGLPEYSFNLVAGVPGAGKTTLAHQIVFANASEAHPALYFTVLGEPSLKMLRYQQQMGFFDPDQVGRVIRFVDLSDQVLEGDLEVLLETIIAHVEEVNPGIVVVDSFRTMMTARPSKREQDIPIQGFLQRLALHLTSWQITSFLVGEYGPEEVQHNPMFTIADGILWLFQSRERNSVVRKLEARKVRGAAPVPGLHTFRIDSDGVHVFPRTSAFELERPPQGSGRVCTGVPGLDAMLGGGVRRGDTTLIAGPSGTGKTAIGTQFIGEGARRGEAGVLAIFEEHPEEYLDRASDMGLDLRAMLDANELALVYLRPLDLSADEILFQIRQAIVQVGAARLVIDSLNALELALAPDFRADFRESLYRLVGSLSHSGVSIVLTVEVTETFDQLIFSPHAISFLAQNILSMRYVEIDGQLRKMMTAIKMRRSAHSTALHEYEITSCGVRVGDALTDYTGLLTGVPKRRAGHERIVPSALSEAERAVLAALLEAHQSTAEALSRDTKLEEPEVTAALERLVRLNYVIEVEEDGAAAYRAAARPLGRPR